MAQVKRNSTIWVLRTLGALAIAFAISAGVAGQVFAHDDENDNEVVTYGPSACSAIADLPVALTATCIKHKTEVDDGATETKDSYTTPASVAAVQQAFAATFAPNGWTIAKAKQDAEDQEWEYKIVKNGRQVEVKIEPQDADEGTGTEFSITAQ